ncbi:hypothetical protein BC829DRAFT_415525 [Chytridium lagenaria]|nr:hypothetical protein BC829DRAFT_415525 [Chytridium lagenaria]
MMLVRSPSCVVLLLLSLFLTTAVAVKEEVPLDPVIAAKIEEIKAKEPDGDWVFRGMTPHDSKSLDAGNGIPSSANAPVKRFPPPLPVIDNVLDHVARKKEGQRSEYISTSTDPKVAQKWNNLNPDSNPGIVAINLNKLSPEQRAQVADISTPEGREAQYGPMPTGADAMALLREDPQTNDARARMKAHGFTDDKEVLIKGDIPADACTRVIRRDLNGVVTLYRRQSCPMPDFSKSAAKKGEAKDAKKAKADGTKKDKKAAAKSTKKAAKASAKSPKGKLPTGAKAKKGPMKAPKGKAPKSAMKKGAKAGDKKAAGKKAVKNAKANGAKGKKGPVKKVVAKKPQGSAKKAVKKGPAKKSAGKTTKAPAKKAVKGPKATTKKAVKGPKATAKKAVKGPKATTKKAVKGPKANTAKKAVKGPKATTKKAVKGPKTNTAKKAVKAPKATAKKAPKKAAAPPKKAAARPKKAAAPPKKAAAPPKKAAAPKQQAQKKPSASPARGGKKK